MTEKIRVDGRTTTVYFGSLLNVDKHKRREAIYSQNQYNLRCRNCDRFYKVSPFQIHQKVSEEYGKNRRIYE